MTSISYMNSKCKNLFLYGFFFFWDSMRFLWNIKWSTQTENFDSYLETVCQSCWRFKRNIFSCWREAGMPLTPFVQRTKLLLFSTLKMRWWGSIRKATHALYLFWYSLSTKAFFFDLIISVLEIQMSMGTTLSFSYHSLDKKAVAASYCVTDLYMRLMVTWTQQTKRNSNN